MIAYTDDVSGLTADDLDGFFVGWPTAPSKQQHLAVLRRSWRAVIAREDRSGRVVGFVHMISDGVLTAFVPWLEVLPEFHRRGIGTELMRRVLAGAEGLYSVDLVCDEPLRPYYRRLGMMDIPGMGLRHSGVLGGQ